jgi:hypothetical protein
MLNQLQVSICPPPLKSDRTWTGGKASVAGELRKKVCAVDRRTRRSRRSPMGSMAYAVTGGAAASGGPFCRDSTSRNSLESLRSDGCGGCSE